MNKPDRENLRKFGMTMGIAFLAITVVILLRHRHSAIPTASISAVFFILGFTAPIILKPVYFAWMKLAFVLGWLNTRLILCLLFYLVFTPTGLVLKILSKDLLDRRIEKEKASYWRKKEEKPFNPLDYEKQY